MNPTRKLQILLLLLCLFACGITQGGERARFLKQRGTEFYLDGKPFYEISFNKFDLFWELLDAEFDNSGSQLETAEKCAAQTLSELHEMGFRTIRLFGCENRNDIYQNPQNRDRYYKVLDKMLSLCDRYDIRTVFSLGCASFIKEGETQYDLITDRNSQSWKMLCDYLHQIINRYKGRSAIAMWELQNELLLMADIGGREGVWNGIKVPTTSQVINFHRDVVAQIRHIDHHHLITSGDSFRTSQWHLNRYCEYKEPVEEWAPDTWQELTSIVSRVEKEVDIYGLHDYLEGADGLGLVADSVTGTLRKIRLSDWRKEAERNHSPFYLGEYGALAHSKSDTLFWKRAPNWFTSLTYDKEAAARVMREIMNEVVDARIQLTHYWTYDSHRACDRNNPQRMDVSLKRDPELIKIICDANRRLQMSTMGFTYMKK